MVDPLLSHYQSENHRLKQTILLLQKQIREQCQNYLNSSSNKPKYINKTRHKSKLSFSQQVINQQICTMLEGKNTPNQPILIDTKLLHQEKNQSDFLNSENGLSNISRVSESEQLISVPHQMRLIKTTFNPQQQSRFSPLLSPPNTFSKNNQSYYNGFFQLESQIQKIKNLEETIRKYEQRIYVYSNIFSDICDIVMGQNSIIAKQLELNQYDNIERGLRNLFSNIKKIKKNSEFISKQNQNIIQTKSRNEEVFKSLMKQKIITEDKQVQVSSQYLSIQLFDSFNSSYSYKNTQVTKFRKSHSFDYIYEKQQIIASQTQKNKLEQFLSDKKTDSIDQLITEQKKMTNIQRQKQCQVNYSTQKLLDKIPIKLMHFRGQPNIRNFSILECFIQPIFYQAAGFFTIQTKLSHIRNSLNHKDLIKNIFFYNDLKIQSSSKLSKENFKRCIFQSYFQDIVKNKQNKSSLAIFPKSPKTIYWNFCSLFRILWIYKRSLHYAMGYGTFLKHIQFISSLSIYCYPVRLMKLQLERNQKGKNF